MRVVQCTRCKHVQITTARTNRPQCKRAIAYNFNLNQAVERCYGPMIQTDTVICWKCNEWQEVNGTDGMLMCNWCGTSLKREHVVKPVNINRL